MHQLLLPFNRLPRPPPLPHRHHTDAWAALLHAKQLHGPTAPFNRTEGAEQLRRMRDLFPATAAGSGASSGGGGVGPMQRALQRLQEWRQRAVAAAGVGDGAVTLADAAAVGKYGGAPPRLRPILVFGLPRSGATLVQQALLR